MSLATLFDFFFLTIKKKSKKKLAQNRHSVTNKIEIQKEINLSTEKRTSVRGVKTTRGGWIFLSTKRLLFENHSLD